MRRSLLLFAREVGTPEVLRKLLILTAADIAAVGPEVLTKWKESLLIELYYQALQEVSGDRETADAPDRLKRIAGEVAAESVFMVDPNADEAWGNRSCTSSPFGMSMEPPPDALRNLAAIRRLHAGEVVVDADFNAQLGTSEYSIVTHNELVPGIFSKIAGVMAASGVQILDAHITTRNDGIVVDTFHVMDPDYQGAPPEERRRTIGDRIAGVRAGSMSSSLCAVDLG